MGGRLGPIPDSPCRLGMAAAYYWFLLNIVPPCAVESSLLIPARNYVAAALRKKQPKKSSHRLRGKRGLFVQAYIPMCLYWEELTDGAWTQRRADGTRHCRLSRTTAKSFGRQRGVYNGNDGLPKTVFCSPFLPRPLKLFPHSSHTFYSYFIFVLISFLFSHFYFFPFLLSSPILYYQPLGFTVVLKLACLRREGKKNSPQKLRK